MSTWIDWVDVTESTFSKDASGGEVQVVTCAVRDAGQEDGQTGRDAEVWGLGCIVYRPAPPDDNGKCQAAVATVGGARVIVATRDTRAATAVGDLGAGDAAFCAPTSKTALIAKSDGSIALLQQGDEADAMIVLEKDGAIILRNKWGQIQLDESGFSVMLTSGESFGIGGAQMTLAADQVNLAGAVIGLGVGASVPLAAVPLLPIALAPGTVGFVSAVPLARILVAP